MGRLAAAARGMQLPAGNELTGRFGGALVLSNGLLALGIVLAGDVERWHTAYLVVVIACLVSGSTSLWVMPWSRLSSWVLVGYSVAGCVFAAVDVTAIGDLAASMRLGLFFTLAFTAFCYPRGVAVALSAGTILACFLVPAVAGSPGGGSPAHALIEATMYFLLAAVAIVGCEQLRRARTAAELLAERQGALHAIATAAAAERPLAEVLDVAVRRAAALLGTDIATVMRNEPDGRVRCAALCARDGATRLRVDDVIAPPRGGVNDALRERAAAVRRDQIDSGLVDLGPSPSVLGVPVHAGGRLWGAINAASVRPLPADAEERLADLADVVGLAVASARARERLTELANTDELTGLANRRAFRARLEAEVRRAHRHDRPLALAIVDLDRFKTINDTGGHEAGDLALQRVAMALTTGSRSSDVVGRIGGDEFAVLLPETSPEAAVELLQTRRGALAAPAAGQPALSISAGVCDASLADGTDRLLQLADAALYEAKAQGRARTVVYEPEALDRAA